MMRSFNHFSRRIRASRRVRVGGEDYARLANSCGPCFPIPAEVGASTRAAFTQRSNSTVRSITCVCSRRAIAASRRPRCVKTLAGKRRRSAARSVASQGDTICRSGGRPPISLNCNSLDGGANRRPPFHILSGKLQWERGWRHFELSFFITRMTLGNLFWQSGTKYILPILRPPWFRPGLSLEPSLQGGRRWLASVSWRTV